MASMGQQTQPARPAYAVPPAPQSPSAQSARSRGFSFRSDKSGGSGNKKDVAESAADKARRDSFWKGQSFANPNAALKELEPGGTLSHHSSKLVFLSPTSPHSILAIHTHTPLVTRRTTMALTMQMTKDIIADSAPEPPVKAIYEESTIVPLRTVQHKDVYGNPISKRRNASTVGETAN